MLKQLLRMKEPPKAILVQKKEMGIVVHNISESRTVPSSDTGEENVIWGFYPQPRSATLFQGER